VGDHVIERIEGAPAGVIAFKAVGRVESSDYRQTLEPAVQEAIATKGSVRLVYELGDEFTGYSPGAAWEDLKLGGGNLSAWERCAVVTDHALLRDAVRAFAVFMPGSVKVFPVAELGEAMSWAAA
jgi:hypothetical protein